MSKHKFQPPVDLRGSAEGTAGDADDPAAFSSYIDDDDPSFGLMTAADEIAHIRSTRPSAAYPQIAERPRTASYAVIPKSSESENSFSDRPKTGTFASLPPERTTAGGLPPESSPAPNVPPSASFLPPEESTGSEPSVPRRQHDFELQKGTESRVNVDLGSSSVRGTTNKEIGAVSAAPPSAGGFSAAVDSPRATGAHLAPSLRSGTLSAISVPKPKRFVFMAGITLLGLSCAIVVIQITTKSSNEAALVARVDEFGDLRGALYGVLDEMLVAGSLLRDDDCPPLIGLDEDTRFGFEQGAPLALFPTSNRHQREQARLVEYQAGTLDREEFETYLNRLAGIGDAVVVARIRDTRAPLAGETQNSSDVSGIRPGYVIADVYVGSLENTELACSFRVFAATSPRIARPRNGDVQQTLNQNLLLQTYEAILSATRGQRANPGRQGGRYDSVSPPLGF